MKELLLKIRLECKQKLQGKDSTSSLAEEQFLLAREIGCLGEIIGREYEFIETNGKITGFRQKPMSIPTYIKLVESFAKVKRREEKQMKKSSKGKRR